MSESRNCSRGAKTSTRAHRVLVWTHRWAGLTAGLLFAFIALTGSLLLFQPQFFRWAHGELIPRNLASGPVSIDAWVKNAKAAVPDLQGPISIWQPHVEHNISDAGMLVFAGRPPGGAGRMGFVAVLVAPSSGRVLGVIDIDRSPAYLPLFLHRDFASGESGRLVSGIMALATLVLLITGLILWWPSTVKRLFRRLSPRPLRTILRARRQHDWIGIWALPLLVVLTATGICLVQPSWVKPVIDKLPAGPEPVLQTSACRAMTFDQAITAARELVPKGRLEALYPHDEAMRRWEITFASPASATRQQETHVLADLHCGAVAIESAPGKRAAHDVANTWIMGLHDGSAFGSAGEIVAAIAGITPVVLSASGVLLWLRGRRRTPHRV